MFVFGGCRTFERAKTDVCLFSLQIKSLGDGRDMHGTEGQDVFCVTQIYMYKKFLVQFTLIVSRFLVSYP